MSTSQKHDNLLKEPMGNKPTTKLPGIGEKYGERLGDQGYTKASQVYGQFLVQNQNHVAFEGWMKDTCQASRKHASDCSKALDDYNKLHN